MQRFSRPAELELGNVERRRPEKRKAKKRRKDGNSWVVRSSRFGTDAFIFGRDASEIYVAILILLYLNFTLQQADTDCIVVTFNTRKPDSILIMHDFVHII